MAQKKIDMSDRLFREVPNLTPLCDRYRVFPWWHWKRWAKVREIEQEGILSMIARKNREARQKEDEMLDHAWHFFRGDYGPKG